MDEQETVVGTLFDAQAGRFRAELTPSDYRLEAVTRGLGPAAGKRILDLGCGKGRFARALQAEGAAVVGLDLSAAMLASARGVPVVRASARRLPFPPASFDGVIAVEVLEHLRDLDSVLAEAARVLRPGGAFVIVDKNAGSWNALRPWLPNLVVKAIDQRRGRWMYPPGSKGRERWFWPGALRRRLRRSFVRVRSEPLLSPEEARRWLFTRFPAARLMTIWSARKPGAGEGLT